MADEEKPKPMSIKERMAAFQQAANKEPAPPPPRPAGKPTNWAWKQKQAEAAAAAASNPPPAPTPSSSVNVEREPEPVDERADSKAGAMSASDAQESTKGMSLKERMAALKASGYGQPAVEQPRPAPPAQPRVWKRPVVPETTGDDGAEPAAALPISLGPASVSPSHERENPVEGAEGEPSDEQAAPVEPSATTEGEVEEEEPDEEEKERQRRAAIAARMAKLGGARGGLGASLFGRAPPPPVPAKSSSAASMEATSAESAAPQARIPLPHLSSSSSIPKVQSPSAEEAEDTPSPAAAQSPPASVKSPPLTVPKRALPPRKKSAPPKQPSVESEAPPAPVDGEEAQPAVTTPRELEPKGDPMEHAATNESSEPRVAEVADEDAAVPHPEDEESTAVITQPVPPVLDIPSPVHTKTAPLNDEEEDGPSGGLAPNDADEETDADKPPVSPATATAIGENALSLLQDDEDEDDEAEQVANTAPPPSSAPPPPPTSAPPPPPPTFVPPALRGGLHDSDEEEEEDNWDSEAPPIPVRPAAASYDEDDVEYSETHTPVPPSETDEPEVPAAMAQAPPSPSSPSRKMSIGSPVATKEAEHEHEQTASVPMSDRPARRSLPPPPPPPAAVVHDADEDEAETGAEGPEEPEDPHAHEVAAAYDQDQEDLSSGPRSPVDTESHPTVTAAPHHAEESIEKSAPEPEMVEDEETARKRGITERMARLGGVRFGVPGMSMPPPRKRDSLPPPPPAGEPASHKEKAEKEEKEEDEETEEAARARRAVIAARLAGQGGMRLGFLPGAPMPPAPPLPVTAAPHVDQEDDDNAESPADDSMTSDDAVKVEAEPESEAEHIDREEAVSPPPLPAGRPGGRPPVPTGYVASHARKPSGPPPPAPAIENADYVMVNEDTSMRRSMSQKRSSMDGRPSRRSLPPPPRPTGTLPPPPPAATRPETEDLSASGQWELPSLPTSEPLEMGEEEYAFVGSHPTRAASPPPRSIKSRPSSMTPSKRSSLPPPPPPPSASLPPPARVPTPRGFTDTTIGPSSSAEDLVALYNRVGKHVFSRAAALVEYSRKSVIGDGSPAGFVRTVLDQVPSASVPPPARSADDALGVNVSYGPIIYVQNGPSVQKRASDIMPGDIATIVAAKLKGHRGLSGYSMNVDAIVGVVSEFEEKKGKLKVWQASMHANAYPTVESVSYRLDDLKTGAIKIYRVAGAS